MQSLQFPLGFDPGCHMETGRLQETLKNTLEIRLNLSHLNTGVFGTN